MNKFLMIVSTVSVLVMTSCETRKPEPLPEESFVEEYEHVADVAPDVFPDLANHIRIVPTMETVFDNHNTVYCANLEYLWNSVLTAVDKPLTTDAFTTQLSQSSSWRNTMDTSKLVLAFGDPLITYDNIVSQYRTKYGIEKNDLSPQGASFWAYTDKIVRYKYAEPFEEEELSFQGQEVSAFGFGSNFDSGFMKEYFKGQYQVLYYNTDGEFVVRLIPDKTTDEIVLAMTKKRETFFELFNATTKMINRGAKEKEKYPSIYNLTTEDELVIPAIRFRAKRSYSELRGLEFSSRYGPIDDVSQVINFDFDRRGIILESNASAADSIGQPSKPKLLRFDKPFYLYIKEAQASNPYFNLWVSDSQILAKKTK